MVINKELLAARKKISDKRPAFIRQESWRYDRLAENWRRPKGIDNKMRRQFAGMPELVKIGYRGPKKSRGLHPSGYTDNLVFNIDGLKLLNSKIDAARISHTVGIKKKNAIVAEAEKLGIKVLNPGKTNKSNTKSNMTSDSNNNNQAEKQ